MSNFKAYQITFLQGSLSEIVDFMQQNILNNWEHGQPRTEK